MHLNKKFIVLLFPKIFNNSFCSVCPNFDGELFINKIKRYLAL